MLDSKVTDLIVSIKLNEVEKVKDAFDSGISVDARYGILEKPILHFAARSKEPALVEEMIKKKANINAIDSNKSTALHIAAIHGNTKVVELLLSYKADINQADKTGSTALHYALEHDMTETATLLINKDADVNILMKEDEYLGYYNMSPLHIAADKKNIEMIKLLISKDADRSLETRGGDTAEEIFDDKFGDKSLTFQSIAALALATKPRSHVTTKENVVALKAVNTGTPLFALTASIKEVVLDKASKDESAKSSKLEKAELLAKEVQLEEQFKKVDSEKKGRSKTNKKTTIRIKIKEIDKELVNIPVSATLAQAETRDVAAPEAESVEPIMVPSFQTINAPLNSHKTESKTLYTITPDGNCLFNAVLIAYVDATGKYPLNNARQEIKTQKDLRQLVSKYYLEKVADQTNVNDFNVADSIRHAIIDAIKIGNFAGWGELEEKLLKIHSIYTKKGKKDEYLEKAIDQSIIEKYIEELGKVDDIWGGGQELDTLSKLLNIKIRLSGQSVAFNASGDDRAPEVEIQYAGGNHYNILLSNPANKKVSELIKTISATIVENNEQPTISESQAGNLGNINANQFKLLIQVIFNKREAENRDTNRAISDAEINYSMGYLSESRIFQSQKAKKSFSRDNMPSNKKNGKAQMERKQETKSDPAKQNTALLRIVEQWKAVAAIDYLDWFNRFERVLNAFKTGRISSDEFTKYQMFLLEFGQFNASFNLEELERLGYSKSPFAIMYDHAYMRATDTWAMQMLSMEYCEQSKHKALCPIWVDSQYFWGELMRYNRVVEASKSGYLAPITKELQANGGRLVNIWWIEIDKPGDSSKNIKTSMERIKKNIIKELIESCLEAKEKLQKDKLVYFFKEKVDFHKRTTEMETMVVIETKHTYPLVNSLGYRMDAVRAIHNILKLYPGLFVDAKITDRFWKNFCITSNFKKLPEKEQNCIQLLYEHIKFQLESEERLVTLSTYSFQEELNALEIRNRNANLPKAFQLYAEYLIRYLQDYTKQNQPNEPIRLVVDTEIQIALKVFLTAIKTGRLEHAVRATQVITEVMQLALMLKPLKVSFPEVVRNSYLKDFQNIQAVALTPYAMRAFVRVLQILAQQPTTRIAVTNQSYYELLENLERIPGHRNSVELIRQVGEINATADIIFLEMHPNNVVESRQYAHDPLQLLKNIKSWTNKQRTLVLDVTLNALDDDEVRDVLDKASPLVDSGYLNIILIQSLTKFAQLGLDKRSAGCIILINNPAVWGVVNQRLQEISAREKVDDSIDNYFAYFGVQFRSLLGSYINCINRNVREVYNDTLGQMNSMETLSRSRFQITMSSDPKACYVAINMNGLLPEVEEGFSSFSIGSLQMEKFSEDILKHMIIPLCQFYGLPITSRFSIGFPLTSVNAVYDSLRFTIGLESPHQLRKYAEILSYTAFVLNRQRHPQIFFHLSPEQLKQKAEEKTDKEKKDGEDGRTYKLREDYLAEKVDQFMAMTPGMGINHSLIFDSGAQYTFPDGVSRFRQILMNFNDGVITGQRESSYLRRSLVWVPFTDIRAHIRELGEISVHDSRLNNIQRKMIAGCFTQVMYPGKTVDQNVNLSIYEENNTLGLPSFESVERWNSKNLYGPFNNGSSTVFFILNQKRIELIFDNNECVESEILVRHGGIDMPLTDLRIEDRAFLIQEGAYDPGVPSLLYSFKQIRLHCKPLPENSIRCFVENNKLVVEHDRQCHGANGVSVLSRSLSGRSSCFEIDFWGEKDPIIARFFRLVTAVYVQRKGTKISFNARDIRFTHFVFNLEQNDGAVLFQEAVDAILGCKELLKEALSDFQNTLGEIKKSELGEIKKSEYSFGDINSRHSASWPSGNSGISCLSKGDLIHTILEKFKIFGTISGTNCQVSVVGGTTLERRLKGIGLSSIDQARSTFSKNVPRAIPQAGNNDNENDKAQNIDVKKVISALEAILNKKSVSWFVSYDQNDGEYVIENKSIREKAEFKDSLSKPLLESNLNKALGNKIKNGDYDNDIETSSDGMVLRISASAEVLESFIQTPNLSGEGTYDAAFSNNFHEFYNIYFSQGIEKILNLRIKSLNLANEGEIKILQAKYFLTESTSNVKALALEVCNAFSCKNTKIALVPFNINNKHWIGLVFEKENDKVTMTYFDSEGGATLQVLKDGLKITLEQRGSIEFLEAPVQKQKYNNCGPEVIENFIFYLTGNRATQETAVYLHSLLLENMQLDPVLSFLQIQENNKLIGVLSNQESLIVDRPIVDIFLEVFMQQGEAIFDMPLTLKTDLSGSPQVQYQLEAFDHVGQVTVQKAISVSSYLIESSVSFSGQTHVQDVTPDALLEADLSTVSSTALVVSGDDLPEAEGFVPESHVKGIFSFAHAYKVFNEFKDYINSFLTPKETPSWKQKLSPKELSDYYRILHDYAIEDSDNNVIPAYGEHHKYKINLKNFIKVHPDKNARGSQEQQSKSTEDYKILNDLNKKLKSESIVKEVATDEMQNIQSIIHKTNMVLKAVDTAVDSARVVYEPTFHNTKKVALDFTYLYSMYYGVNGYSSVIGAVDVLRLAYQEEYTQALKQVATTIGYMALPSMLAYTAIPYLGFAYGVGMTVYTGYSAFNNAYSYYLERNDVESMHRSTIAYKDLTKTLSESPLQQLYDFASITKEYEFQINNINLAMEKAAIKTQLEEKGEFGRKLYEYVYEPSVEEKYDLLNKVLQGSITREEAEGLKAKHIKITSDDQSYEHCMEVSNTDADTNGEHYYCYNEEQEVLNHILIGDNNYIQIIGYLG